MRLKSNYKKIKNILILATAVLSVTSFANGQGKVKEKSGFKYRNSFGNCPSRAAGNFSFQIIKNFEENKSLYEVKKLIVENKLTEKHFISDYKISFDPVDQFLSLDLTCPKPLMKTQVYKTNAQDSYEAILVETGELYDPTYEVLLRTEDKIKGDLPYFALPIDELGKENQKVITSLVKSMDDSFVKKLSEVIVSDEHELTIILSINGRPCSVFFGQTEWREKMNYLERAITYLVSEKKIPVIINLTNLEKVVVKFKK